MSCQVISSTDLGPQGPLNSILTFGVRNQGDFLDGAWLFCNVMHLTTGSQAAGKLGEGFALASLATGAAGIAQAGDFFVSACAADLSIGDRVGMIAAGTTFTLYTGAKVASFAESTGACSLLPAWVNRVGKAALGVLVALGLYGNVQVLSQPIEEGVDELQKKLLEKRWWKHAFDLGSNLSTLIYAVSAVAGYALAPVFGVFLATTYLVCAVVSYVFAKDMEQAAIKNGLKKV